MASSFPRNLILATEIGYHAISGIHAVDIDSWSTFKSYLRQLDKPSVKQKFDTVTIDTISLLWDLCEKYICSQHDVKALSDIAWGKGFKACSNEFSDALRKITLMGYGIVCIAHSEIRTEEDGNNEIEFVAPALNKRPYAIVNQLVDIIGYIGHNDNGERVIYTRATPTVMAGSRYQYLAPVIPFGYEALSNALADAVEEAAKHGGIVVDAPINRFAALSSSRSFDETMNEAKALFEKLLQKNDDAIMDKVVESIERYFKVPGFRLSEAKSEQQELVEAVITEMRNLA